MARMKLTRRNVLAGTAAALSASSSARAEAAVVRIGVQPSLSYPPLYVVKERGLIEKHG